MKCIFVDTENTGNLWIDSVKECANDVFYVFYTDKSPNLTYSEVERIISQGNTIKFIRCKSGKNALDFQLSTELGYTIGSKVCDGYLILSRDTGFDAVVDYWQRLGVDISRAEGINDDSPKASHTDERISAANTALEESKELLYIIGRSDMNCLSLCLSLIYGEKKGHKLFRTFKVNNAFSNYLKNHPPMTCTEKQHRYCRIVAANDKTTEPLPDDFSEVAVNIWGIKPNLNFFKAELRKKYGKEKGGKLYLAFKEHIRIICNISPSTLSTSE